MLNPLKCCCHNSCLELPVWVFTIFQGDPVGIVVEYQSPNLEVLGSSPLMAPCCVFEQDKLCHQSMCWIRPDITEKLLTVTLNHRYTQTIFLRHPRAFLACLKEVFLHRSYTDSMLMQIVLCLFIITSIMIFYKTFVVVGSWFEP